MAEGFGYFDKDGALIVLGADQKTLEGTVSVREAPGTTPEPTATLTAASPSAPRTGDGADVLPWVLLLTAFGAALMAVLFLRRREGR